MLFLILVTKNPNHFGSEARNQWLATSYLSYDLWIMRRPGLVSGVLHWFCLTMLTSLPMLIRNFSPRLLFWIQSRLLEWILPLTVARPTAQPRPSSLEPAVWFTIPVKCAKPFTVELNIVLSRWRHLPLLVTMENEDQAVPVYVASNHMTVMGKRTPSLRSIWRGWVVVLRIYQGDCVCVARGTLPPEALKHVSWQPKTVIFFT